MSDSTFKQPQDVIDYDISAEPYFKAFPDDDIQSVTFTITSFSEETPTLVLGPAPHPTHQLLGAQPKSFKIWVGGGTSGHDYTINMLIRTERDRAKEYELKVKVRDK